MRFPRLLRAQNVWPDRHRRALRTGRNPRFDAAMARWRRDDRERHLGKERIKKAPHRFEAGTPNIAGAIGLAAAIQYIEQIGRPAIFEHDSHLARYAAERLTELPGMRVFGPTEERGALVGFVMDAAHPHDLTTFADQYGLALRGGHHCNQPLMRRFGVPGTTRASFYFYNTTEEIDRMIEILGEAVRFFS